METAHKEAGEPTVNASAEPGRQREGLLLSGLLSVKRKVFLVPIQGTMNSGGRDGFREVKSANPGFST